MKSKELKLYLSIRWTGGFGKKGAACALKLIQFLEDSRIPAHWILPCYPVLERAQYLPLVEEIRNRIHSHMDHLLPMGYSGAMHTALSLSELARELRWCRQNPWGSGVRDVFEIDPSFLYPSVADLYRGQALRSYRRHGFTGIGITRRVTDSRPFRTVIRSDPSPLTVYSLPTLILHASAFDGGRILGKRDSLRLILMIDLDNAPSPEQPAVTETLRQLLGQLSRRHLLTYHRLLSGLESFQRDIAAPETREIDPDGDTYAYELYSDPLSRRSAAAALPLRGRGEPTTRSYRTLLRRMSAHRLVPTPPRAVKEKDSFPNLSRQAVAAMGGSASLRGSRFTAHFQSGRLSGIEDRGEFVAMNSPASSYLVMNGKLLPFTASGSFSIEGDAVRGLRCLENVEGNSPTNSASMIVEYFMVEDFPLLLTTTLVRYPNLDEGDLAAVLHEINLFRLERGERCRIAGLYPDGTDYRLTVTDAPRQQTLAGSLFFVKPESYSRNKPGIILGFPLKREALSGTVTFTLRRKKNHTVLQAAPNAGYGRAARFKAMEETFSFYLGISRDRPRRIPAFPPQILREVPRHRFHPGNVGGRPADS